MSVFPWTVDRISEGISRWLASATTEPYGLRDVEPNQQTHNTAQI